MKFNIAEITKVFFAAMKEGYASEITETSIAGMPGSKLIEFRQGIYMVKDLWFVSPHAPHSFGQTIIWANEVPVWHMQYMGQYQDEAIPFLKSALRSNYEASTFYGGRGPKLYVANRDGLEYINVTDTPEFDYFLGIETVNKDGHYLGSHRYQGSILFETD